IVAFTLKIVNDIPDMLPVRYQMDSLASAELFGLYRSRFQIQPGNIAEPYEQIVSVLGKRGKTELFALWQHESPRCLVSLRRQQQNLISHVLVARRQCHDDLFTVSNELSVGDGGIRLGRQLVEYRHHGPGSMIIQSDPRILGIRIEVREEDFPAVGAPGRPSGAG